MSHSAPATRARPVLHGERGAISAAHPLAVAAAQELLVAGGNAVDALMAAQAVLCVVTPEACGLGGDALVQIVESDGKVTAVNGTGAAPSDPSFSTVSDGGLAITVPGIVHAWETMSGKWSKAGLKECLRPAIQLADTGVRLPDSVRAAVLEQSARLSAGGADDWVVCRTGCADGQIAQPELADLLSAIAADGSKAFYTGHMADAVERAVTSRGGLLTAGDLAAHDTEIRQPVSVQWNGGTVHVQPPMTQGVLLAMCLGALERLGEVPADKLDHVCVELTEEAFGHRDRVGDGDTLLGVTLTPDFDKASLRRGPRAYLHTAGVAVADDDGLVASSLISVFDHFGSCVYVPEGGFVLNNRAQGFTAAPNHPESGKKLVHTLAPILVEKGGDTVALATPGADGQVQTLLQILAGTAIEGVSLADAIDRPRWRSEDGKLLVADN
ncbi:MAG: gamma-glutamyltransferase, partial [Hyphomicrobiales bacterium]